MVRWQAQLFISLKFLHREWHFVKICWMNVCKWQLKEWQRNWEADGELYVGKWGANVTKQWQYLRFPPLSCSSNITNTTRIMANDQHFHVVFSHFFFFAVVFSLRLSSMSSLLDNIMLSIWYKVEPSTDNCPNWCSKEFNVPNDVVKYQLEFFLSLFLSFFTKKLSYTHPTTLTRSRYWWKCDGRIHQMRMPQQQKQQNI